MKRREHLSPDLTPLIDVIFLILIFFMVSSTFKKEELALLLVLPESDSAAQEIKREELNIELTADEIAVRGKRVTFSQLEKIVSEIKEKQKPVNMRIDKDVTYERIVKIFDLLNRYDLNNLALESTKPR